MESGRRPAARPSVPARWRVREPAVDRTPVTPRLMGEKARRQRAHRSSSADFAAAAAPSRRSFPRTVRQSVHGRTPARGASPTEPRWRVEQRIPLEYGRDARGRRNDRVREEDNLDRSTYRRIAFTPFAPLPLSGRCSRSADACSLAKRAIFVGVTERRSAARILCRGSVQHIFGTRCARWFPGCAVRPRCRKAGVRRWSCTHSPLRRLQPCGRRPQKRKRAADQHGNPRGSIRDRFGSHTR